LALAEYHAELLAAAALEVMTPLMNRRRDTLSSTV
jgi:hypothetical protein